MALRIRKDGRVLCAAMHAAEPGDTYLDDGIHYMLSAEKKLLVTEPMERHKLRGEWWWSGNVPGDVSPEAFYLRPNNSRTGEPIKTPCCGVALSGSALQPYPVYWNPHNGVVQCHCCGTIYDPRNSKPNHDDCCGQWPKHASNCNYATGN